MEKAIIMAVDCIKKKCTNEKPLILHSVRVGFKLKELNQPKEVVIAGILHDLVEDTDCTISQIKRKFGQKVASLVSACSCPYQKNDKDRWLKFLNKIERAGKRAIFIKLADANDNLPYTELIKDQAYLKRILWKHQMVVEKLKPKMKNYQIFKEYYKNYKKMLRKLKTE